MGLIKGKNSKPEMAVRHLVHRMGYRYRLHSTNLPGRPDLVFPIRKKVIFVHGCFWHRHGENCALTRMPKSRLEFWRPKLEGNASRDLRNQDDLRVLGWEFLLIWECQVKELNDLDNRIREFLG